MTAESARPNRIPAFNRISRRAATLILAPAIAMLGGGCDQPAVVGAYQGYLEAEYVCVASPYGGALRELTVVRGAEVNAGQPLFVLDPEPEAQALQESVEKLRKAEAQLADAQKGRRPSELEALEAQVRSTQTELTLATQLLQRREQLAATNVGAVAAEVLDESRSRVASLRAQLARLNAELETARLGAREDQIRAADAEVATARAGLARADWVVAQKKQAAVVAGTVHDTLYRPGEWVTPGNPVVVLLPPENIKVRFFVPEAELAKMQTGRGVTIRFDGAPQPLTATINFISTRAEFTPPVIYSKQTRTKLVFMVEAKFAASEAAGLRPGQPVDVTLQP
jgi:HlyD family secretion protein